MLTSRHLFHRGVSSLSLYCAIMKGIYKLGKYVPNIAASCWVAPNAAVVGNVIMKEHASVWFGATVRGDNLEPITVGAR
jgi:carbonic anhydrase/acetyltransferase-like protein (isoleucine patch superfamily)